MIDHGDRIGNKAVKRNKRGQGRKKSQQQIEGRSSGDKEYAILKNFGLDAPQDVSPPSGRDL
jgi:hypothetical protein